jgi:hypothetical protein
MATYYVRTPANGGSDAAAGTSTTTAWATFTRAFSASGFTSGDTVYVEPGVYRETVTALNTSPTTRAFVIGDYDGAIFGTVGEVRWSGFLTTDDAAGTGTTLLNMNTRDNITIRGIRFESVSRCIDVPNGSINIDIEDCVLINQAQGTIAMSSGASVALGCNIRRCIVSGLSDAILIVPNLNGGSDWNLNLNIENCVITSTQNRGIFFSSTGSGRVASAVTVKNCTIRSATGIQAASNAYRTGPAGIVVTNTLFYQCVTGITAGTTGQVSENFNRFALCSTPTTNIGTNGANTNLVGNLSIDMGRSFLFDLNPRTPWYMPYVANIINGDGTATGMPTNDIHGTTRPNPPAIGASEQTTLYASAGMLVHSGMSGGIRG